MNIRLSGDSPEFAGFVFAVRDGRVTARPADPSAPGLSLSTQLVAALGGALPAGARERGLEVDQTNRSVIVGDRWIVKHIDRWGTADRSALIERALAGEESLDVPVFLGCVEWEHPVRGISTIALVSEYVPHASDGWTWAAGDVLSALGGSDPDWPARVGELVARVHADLAAAPFPAGSAQQTQRRLDPAAYDAGPAQRIAGELTQNYAGRQDPAALRMRARIPALLAAAAQMPADWMPVPAVTHGDLHVGQIIRTPARRYLLLDFDGDPQEVVAGGFRWEPLERDLAHLLNSIDLVAAVAQKRLGRADPALWAWAERAGEQFLAAYRAVAAARGSAALDERALPALRAEQSLLELRYAERYLPEWEYAPDAAISFRYPPHSTEETPPWTPPDSSTT